MNNPEEKLEQHKTPSQLQMENEKMWLLVLKYCVPTIMSMLIMALYILVDRFWVARLPGEAGVLSLTAIGLSAPILNVVMGFSQLIAIGASSTISIALGKKDKKNAEEILHNSIILSFLISLIVTILGLIFAESVLFILGANETTIQYALPYTQIILSATIFYILANTLGNTVRATGSVKVFAAAQIMGSLVNIILDPILIFTFGLGIMGAAYATAISQLSIAIFMAIYYLRGKSSLGLKRSSFKFNYEVCKKIVVMGMAPFLMTASSSLVISVANTQLIRYGEQELGNGAIALGAMTVISSVLMVFFMPIIGINKGIQPIIGYNYGSKNYKRLKEAYKWGVVYATIICLTGSTLVFLFAPQIVTIFNSDPLLVEVTARGMRIFLFALPFVAIQVVSANLFQAIGKPKTAIFLSALRQIILYIPLYIILPSFFGLTGIWMVAPTADTIAFLVTLIFVIRQMRQLSKQEIYVNK